MEETIFKAKGRTVMKTVSLIELCYSVTDCPHSTPKWTNAGKIVIRNQNIRNGRLDTSSVSYTTQEDYDKRIKRALPNVGDIIITREAPMGEVCMIPDNLECCLGQRMVLLKPNKDLVDNNYLLYALQSPYVQNQISWSEGTGTTVSNLRIPHLKKLQIPIIELIKQRKIAKLLANLDKKIAVNNEINDNLANQIQAIYCNSYDSIAYKPSGILADICHYSTDKVPVSDLSVSTYYSTENMQPNKLGAVDATSLPSMSQTTKCHKGDVLISNIRPYFKKIVYATNECGCSTDVLCFSPKENILSAFLFGTLYLDRFFDYMVAGSKGTKMPRGDKQQIMNYPIVIPSKESLTIYNETVLPMLEQIACNRAENKRLTDLRDTLMPKLMSGEIDVSAIQL
ncbi:restriction endonuclease subunit S [Schaedlerella arabinosiphila]|jgi:type I restriction enzyme S subunit|uniref:Restriction endonuclease subunit S n=1 Tax=Schaedlerella arabinosiphila TaxID=2044587 RepID=A0A3R8JQG0_9FIRM|nr:restriction endonuclease subunit S [Schaedlerella arabinosiphila]RRK33492.1 restriction endonuclease subunit S [Schaedlerella arabinosiphila]